MIATDLATDLAQQQTYLWISGSPDLGLIRMALDIFRSHQKGGACQ